MNNGNVASRIVELERVLDEYDRRFLLNKVQINPEVEKILELKQDELKALSRETCYAYAFMLVQFSIAVQKEYNRQTAKKKWAEHNLDILVAQQCGNYGDKYTKYEAKKCMIVAENDYGKALHNVIVDADCNIEEFNFLSKTISSMGEILESYGKSKRD